MRRCIPSGFVIRQEQLLTTASSEPEPDLSVVRGSSADYREQHPTQSTVFEGVQTVACAALPGFEVSLPALFA